MIRGRKAIVFSIVVVFMFAIALAGNAQACVGRKLVLGSVEDARSSLVSRMLSILINERTGTTVEIEFFPNEEKLYKMVKKHKVDLFVGYVDQFMNRLDDSPGELGMEEKFKLVKRKFDEEQNMIWLKPMGFSGRDETGSSLGWGATVVRKSVLKKFPALPRLLEKIGTRITLDDEILDSLVDRVPESKPARVARDFLKEKKLI